MKSVLISIQPKWVEKIASGEKTIEVRKNKPNLATPFKCYIYCTNRPFDITDIQDLNVESVKKTAFGRGKVIGEFVCDRIDSWQDHELHITNFTKLACLSFDELVEYSDNFKQNLYGWHISNLKIYDNPKELSEFRTPCKMGDYPCCGICDYAVHGMDGDLIDCDTSLTRPPQSWCYVESLGE